MIRQLQGNFNELYLQSLQRVLEMEEFSRQNFHILAYQVQGMVADQLPEVTNCEKTNASETQHTGVLHSGKYEEMN